MKRLSFSIAINLLTENFKKGTNTVINQFRAIQMQIVTFAAALGAGGIGLMGLVSRMKDVARETSRAITALKNVSGTTGLFADNLKFLNSLAKIYGVEINTLVFNFAKFKAAGDSVGMSLLDQRKIFEATSRAAVAYGMSAEDTNLTFLAITQMMSKGKISSEELRRQLGERLPIAMAAMAKAAGVPITKLDDLLKKGKLLSADVLPKFADALNEMIPNVNTDNIETSMNRLSNVFTKFTEEAGIGAKFKVIIDGLTGLIDSASKNIQNIIVGIIATIVFFVTSSLTKVYQSYASVSQQIIVNANVTHNKLRAAIAARVQAEIAYNDAVLRHSQATGQKQIALAREVERAKQTLSARTAAVTKAHEAAKAAAAQAAAIRSRGAWSSAYLMMAGTVQKLGTAIKTMWNTFTPAIIISAIVAVIGYLKNLKEETGWLEKATEEYNKDAAKEQLNIEILFNRLKRAKEGTQDYEKAKSDILSKYGSYLSGLSDEIKKLKDVEGAYKAISAAALQSAKDRAITKNTDAANDEYLDSWAKNVTELQKRLKDKYGDGGGTLLYEEITGYLNADKAIPAPIQNLINESKKTYYGSSATGGGSSSHNPVQQLINNINAAKRDRDKKLSDIRAAFGEISTLDTQENNVPPVKDKDAKSDKTEDKRLEALRKLDEADRQRQIDKIAFDNEMRQKSIDNMEDGFLKEFAQLKLNNDRELAEIEQFKEKISKAQIEEIKNQYISKHGNTKGFESYIKTVKLDDVLPEGLKPQDVDTQVKQLTDAANAALQSGLTKLYKESASFQNEERLRFASQLDQQLYDIKVHYEKRLQLAKGNGDLTKQIIENQNKETKAAILQALDRQLDFELQYNQKVKELVSDRHIFEADKKKEALTQEIKDQKKIFNNLEKQVLNDPNNDELARQLKAAYIQLKLLNKELEKTKSEKLREIAQGASDIFSSLRSTLSDFGLEFSEDTNKVLDGVGQTLDGLASIDFTNPISIITGGLKALGGVAKTMSGIFGTADYSEYNELKSKYDNLLDIWNELIDKKKEYLSTSTADEVNRVEKETLDLIEKQSDAIKKLAQSRLDSGSSAGSHSLWYRMWKGSYKFDGKNWQDVAGEISKELGTPFNSMSDMLNMTGEQLQWIKENYSGLWSVMDGDFKGYLEQLILYGDQAVEVIKQAKEQLTGVSFDNLKDSFLNTLSDMDSSAKDFADDFSGYLQKAILKAMLDKTYAKRLEDWYDSFAEANRDGVIDKGEYERLRVEWDSIVNDSIADRDKLKELFGWTSEGDFSQDSSKGYSVSMDQETGGAILGRITGLHETGLRMESILSGISMSTTNIFSQNVSINNELKKQTVLLDEIKQIQTKSFFHVEEMNGTLNNAVKKLDKIDKNTQNL